MTVIETPQPVVRSPQIWPLGVKAYHALGELGLVPEKTELLYGQIFHQMPESPLHRLLFMRLLQWILPSLPPGLHVQPEKPIICEDSEPVPALSVICGSINKNPAPPLTSHQSQYGEWVGFFSNLGCRLVARARGLAPVGVLVCAGIFFASAVSSGAYTNLAAAYAAAGFDPNYPGNAVVVQFSDPHLHTFPDDGHVIATNLNPLLVQTINAMDPPPTKVIVSGDLGSTYSTVPGQLWNPWYASWATNELQYWYPAIAALTNVATSNIVWVPGNHDQMADELNAGLFCTLLQRPPHQVLTVSGVNFLLMNGGNCGMPSVPEQKWVRARVAAMDPAANIAVVVHQLPYAVAEERGIPLLLREAFRSRTNGWWVFCGHAHTQHTDCFLLGESRYALKVCGTANTNAFSGTTYSAGCRILCLSNGIAASLYFHYNSRDFEVEPTPDWDHPRPWFAAFEEVPGLLWRRLKTPTPAPEVIYARTHGSLYWYAYTEELQWELSLARHNNQATHFLMLSGGLGGQLSFSSDRTNWVPVVISAPTNADYQFPIPPEFRSVPTLYVRYIGIWGDNNFIGGWGLSSTNPGPHMTFPQLRPIPDQRTVVGRPAIVRAVAEDPYAPPDVLSFSLLSAPMGATMDSGGNFYWLPGTNDYPGPWPVTVKVRDAGTPEMAATNSFRIFVATNAASPLTAAYKPGEGIEIRSPCITGTRYELRFSTNLTNWTVLAVTNPVAAELRFIDSGLSRAAGFYRLVLVAQ